MPQPTLIEALLYFLHRLTALAAYDAWKLVLEKLKSFPKVGRGQRFRSRASGGSTIIDNQMSSCRAEKPLKRCGIGCADAK